MEVLQNILIAAIGAIPPSLLAWAALKQARRATEKVIETKDKVIEGNDKTDTIDLKTDGLQASVDEVHGLTNSNFSRVLADQKLAIRELLQAKEQVAKFETLATALLAKLNGDQSDRDALAKAKKR